MKLRVLRNTLGHRTSVVPGLALLAVGLIFVMGGAAAALQPDRAQILNLLGSAFGSALAAISAILVIEYDRRRSDRRRQRIFEGLLDRIEAAARSRFDTPRQAQDLVTALSQLARTVEALAIELQAEVEGVAESLIYLTNLTAIAEHVAKLMMEPDANEIELATTLAETAADLVLSARVTFRVPNE